MFLNKDLENSANGKTVALTSTYRRSLFSTYGHVNFCGCLQKYKDVQAYLIGKKRDLPSKQTWSLDPNFTISSPDVDMRRLWGLPGPHRTLCDETRPELCMGFEWGWIISTFLILTSAGQISHTQVNLFDVNCSEGRRSYLFLSALVVPLSNKKPLGI
jgi:hypothetical protein